MTGVALDVAGADATGVDLAGFLFFAGFSAAERGFFAGTGVVGAGGVLEGAANSFDVDELSNAPAAYAAMAPPARSTMRNAAARPLDD
jgi:hypothetical protein